MHVDVASTSLRDLIRFTSHNLRVFGPKRNRSLHEGTSQRNYGTQYSRRVGKLILIYLFENKHNRTMVSIMLITVLNLFAF